MKPLRLLESFGRFWYDFVVGDDWVVAAGVAVGLGATYGLVATPGVPGFWLLPVAVVGVILLAVTRANRRPGS